MPYTELENAYNMRKQVFNSRYPLELVNKLYSRMKRGVEVRASDLLKYDDNAPIKFADLFVGIPQVQEVINDIGEAFEEVEAGGEFFVKAVYGDFGHGKSQTAHLSIANIMLSDKTEMRVAHLENITSFTLFIENFAKSMEEQLTQTEQGKKIMESIQNMIDDLKSPSLSLGENIQTFIHVVQELSRQDITVVVYLDEVDKIIHDEKDIREWIDFFVSINDVSDFKLLLVLFMPQNVSDRLINTDSRMERWMHFFEMAPVFLDGQYRAKTIDGIANMLAISAIAKGYELTKKEFEYAYNAYLHKHNYLEQASIRSVNIWALNLGETLNSCTKLGMWHLWDALKLQNPAIQYKTIKSKFTTLLNIDELSQFDIKLDDSDDIRTYRVEFSNKGIEILDKITDGQFRMYMRSSGGETLAHTIVVDIEYTLDNNYPPEVLQSVLNHAKLYPTIFISIGLSLDAEKLIKTQIKNEVRQEPNLYPIEVINIPRDLLAPLMILKEDAPRSQILKVRGILRNWGRNITEHRLKLEKFLKNLPDLMVERRIHLRTFELADIPGSTTSDTSDSETTPSGKTPSVRQAATFLAASMISRINEVKSYKQRITLEKDLRKDLDSHYPLHTDTVMVYLQNMISVLGQNNLIFFGRRGQHDTINKTPSWNDSLAMDLLREQVIRLI